MKRLLVVCSAILLTSAAVFAQQKEQIVKTGYNFGPFPIIAFDADKGVQMGAMLNIYNFGDGSNYPNYNSKIEVQGSYFTKGSQMYIVNYDNKSLIPGVRWTVAATFQKENAMDFYGFNGYQTFYDHEKIDAGKRGESFQYSPFYKMKRTWFLAKSDFTGHITDHLYWKAGYQATYIKTGAIDLANVNKGKKDEQKYPESLSTLYEEYVKNGNISPEEAEGGFSSSLRAGVEYDSRNKEGAPSKGIWVAGHINVSPKWLGSKNEYYRYTLTWRHYVPIVKNDVLTFAYRLNYEGNFGDKAPFYVLPFISVLGENLDKDGMGGYRTVRGILRDRVVGLDMASYNAEFRWRFTSFHVGKQNIALGLNAFSDGAMVTRQIKIVDEFTKEMPHITVGAGFRFIMNENFILCAEYGMPVSNFYSKTSPLYKQDGPGAFYINTGFLF